MSTWLTTLVTLASVLFGGGGLAVLINAVTGRRTRKAEVADRLSESTLKWVEQFQEETTQARREASDARREVAEMRREVQQLRADAEQLGHELRSIRMLILSPAATLEQLRAAVSGPGQLNGR